MLCMSLLCMPFAAPYVPESMHNPCCGSTLCHGQHCMLCCAVIKFVGWVGATARCAAEWVSHCSLPVPFFLHHRHKSPAHQTPTLVSLWQLDYQLAQTLKGSACSAAHCAEWCFVQQQQSGFSLAWACVAGPLRSSRVWHLLCVVDKCMPVSRLAVFVLSLSLVAVRVPLT